MNPPSPGRTLHPALAALALVVLPSQAGAGGAMVVDDAQIAPLNTCQVESWTSFARNHDFNGVSAPACTLDFGRPVELSTQVQRLRVDGDWHSLVTFQAKTIFKPVETGTFGVGLVGATVLDLIHNRNAGSYAYVPVTFAVLEQFRVNVNAGWLHDSVANLHWITWGSGLEWTVVKRVTVLAEVFGQVGPRPIGLRSLTDPRMQAGLRFTPVDTFDIDIIYGHNITGVRTHWITVGLNVRFGG